MLNGWTESEKQHFRKQLITQLMLYVRSSIGRDNVWGRIPDQAWTLTPVGVEAGGEKPSAIRLGKYLKCK